MSKAVPDLCVCSLSETAEVAEGGKKNLGHAGVHPVSNTACLFGECSRAKDRLEDLKRTVKLYIVPGQV